MGLIRRILRVNGKLGDIQRRAYLYPDSRQDWQWLGAAAMVMRTSGSCSSFRQTLLEKKSRSWTQGRVEIRPVGPTWRVLEAGIDAASTAVGRSIASTSMSAWSLPACSHAPLRAERWGGGEVL